MNPPTCHRPGCDRPADIRISDELFLCISDALPMIPSYLRMVP